MVARKHATVWKEDTQGIDDPIEQQFCIQQRLLESFLTAVQIELSKIT